jgi:hypothetical protein
MLWWSSRSKTLPVLKDQGITVHDNRGGLGIRDRQGLTHLAAVEAAKAPTQLLSIGITQQHGPVGLELTLHGRHTHQQQGGTSMQEGLTGTLVEAQFPLWNQNVGQPAATVTEGFGVGMKDSAAPVSLEQSG